VRSTDPMIVLASMVFPAACGGPQASPPAPTGAPTTSASAEGSGEVAAAPAPAPGSAPWPKSCAGGSRDLCVPPGSFVDRLCAKPHQDAALALFTTSTPFTRLYLKSRIDELAFDEEVLALRFHGQPKGGMVVGSGNGTYDVLRWDGSCAIGVEAEVFARARPPKPRSAHVQWHRIGPRLQDSLVASCDAVKRAHTRRGKECKGAMSGDVSAACEKADGALVDAIVGCVRSGAEIDRGEGL
jgi:hypothetical protein